MSVAAPGASLAEYYREVRDRSVRIVEPLEIEDFTIQPMADASPPKWHLAHVSWFFETFLLKPADSGYVPVHPDFETLFNSYYNGVGQPFPRARRGTLSRPTVREVMAYRATIDERMLALLAGELTPAQRFAVTLGLHHEEQHQELLHTDIKYNLGNNPLQPAYRAAELPVAELMDLGFIEFEAARVAIGNGGNDGFCFDNESPRHDVLVGNYSLADRLVTCGEYLEFIDAGGYEDHKLWLSDGWAHLASLGPDRWRAPLYWFEDQGQWWEYTLRGARMVDEAAPVCHVSGYEADAYARWRGARLPTEAEWEHAVHGLPIAGNLYESDHVHPVGAPTGSGLRQVYGDAWEWTSSAYGPYPGYREFAGALGEYNGKFMANQLVLRGGSCVTPASHVRPTYRNFFYPPDRWQFSGIRLARDPA